MPKYAEGTSVPVQRSKDELRRLLIKHGADPISFYEQRSGDDAVFFQMRKRWLRFRITMPPTTVFDYVKTSSGGKRRRSARERGSAWEAEYRRRWRVLLLRIKAKLEMVEENEWWEEFMPYMIVGPEGQTMYEAAAEWHERAEHQGEETTTPHLLSG